MLPLKLIPKGRSKKDKVAYLFWRRWVKQNRKKIEKQIKDMEKEYILYGTIKGRRRIKAWLKK